MTQGKFWFALFAGAALATVALVQVAVRQITALSAVQITAAKPTAIDLLLTQPNPNRDRPPAPKATAAPRPSPAEILLAELREKLATGASVDEVVPLLDRLAAEDPHVAVAAGEEAAHMGYSDVPGLLQAVTESLLKANQAEVASQAVNSWATGPLHGAMSNAIFEEVSAHLAQNSLPAGLQWLQTFPVSEERNYALGSLAASWAASDPQAAMAWAMGLSPADGRADAMQRVFNRWSGQDTATAAQWLGAHASDPAADQLIVEMVGDSPLLQSNPRLAATWVESISDAELRQRYFASVILPWGREDASAAIHYLTTDSLLPNDQKEQFLQALHSL